MAIAEIAIYNLITIIVSPDIPGFCKITSSVPDFNAGLTVQ
jgi:hypothetical protein